MSHNGFEFAAVGPAVVGPAVGVAVGIVVGVEVEGLPVGVRLVGEVGEVGEVGVRLGVLVLGAVKCV